MINYLQNILLVLFLLIALPTWANELTGAKGKVLVQVSAETPDDLWRAKALEGYIFKTLDNFAKVEVVHHEIDDLPRCQIEKPQCLANLNQGHGIDILWTGHLLKGGKFVFAVYDLESQSIISSSSFKIVQNANLQRFQQRLFSAIKPAIEKGGIFDQKEFQKNPTTVPIGAVINRQNQFTKTADIHWTLQIIGLVTLLCLVSYTMIPRAFGKTLNKSELSLPIHIEIISWIIWSLLLSIIAFQIIDKHYFAKINYFMPFSKQSIMLSSSQTAHLILQIITGSLWGVLALICFKVIFPQLRGLERVRHWNLFEIIKSWTVVTGVRFLAVGSLLAILYCVVPIVSNVLTGSSAYYMNLIPITSLVFLHWLLLLTHRLSLTHDQNYVIGSASVENPWHKVIKKYFIGYIKRIGIDFNLSTIEKVLFLPGNVDRPITYGGGLSLTRIVIPFVDLSMALGELGDNEEGPDHPVHIKDSLSGMIKPNDPKISRKAHKKINLGKRPTELSLDTSGMRYKNIDFTGPADRKLGIVLPASVDQSVPLISDNQEDLLTLEELISEQIKNRHKISVSEDELDDSNPNHKDFLFGQLLHEFGKAERQDGLITTYFEYFKKVTFKVPHWLEILPTFIRKILYELFAKYFSIVNDTYVALNFGVHHLLQYLNYKRLGSEAPLTARADKTALYSLSRNILVNVKAEIEGSESKLIEAQKNHRFIWLSHFFYSPIRLKTKSKSLLLAAGVLLCILGVGFNATINSIEYHKTWLKIIEKEKIELNKKKENNLKREALNGK